MRPTFLLAIPAVIAVAIAAPSPFCAGQSVLATPVISARSSPAIPSVQAPESGPAPNAGQAPLLEPARKGDSTAPAGEPSPVPAPGAARMTGPLAERSEFERYAEDAVGRRLAVYGRQLFDQVPTTFAPVENVPVPADYVLGPGDQLLIRAWGKIEIDARATVDRNGQIALPRVGTLTVAGLRYAQAEGYLRAAIGTLFKDFELNVALGQLRSIQVFVLGNARQPGTYTVGSLSTLVDALFASGGPSVTGTMRRIQLRREGRTVSEFDLYDLIERGDKSRDIQLLPGDVIFVPAVGPQIAIGGDVNRPGIYELKGETTVAVALEGAGGMTSLADAERAVLERIENHSSRTVEQFALDASGQARMVRDGDLLRVFPLSPKFANAVTLRGNAARPGLYPWREGMSVSDLIPSRAFLITRRYWNRQNHLVGPEPEDPFAGQAMNEAENPPAGQPEETDSGPVQAIGRNSAEINWEYALIERLDERDLSTSLIPFNLGAALDTPASADNRQLKPGDVVTVFSRADLELPMDKHASFVRVGGEVNAPGVYRVNPGETLLDIVGRAGGLTRNSYLYASIFTRVSARAAQEAQLRQSTEQLQRELVSKYANAAPQGGGQTANDPQAQLALQQAALARLTSIKPTGRVVLDLKPDAEAAEIPTLPLEDGDSFYIPPRLGTVQVAGAVYNANAFRYTPGLRLVRYLNDAGGATREADRKRIFVIRADGRVVSRQSRDLHFQGNFEHLRLLPGDAIVVPEKLRVSSPMNEFLQTTQFLSQLALTAAALSVIK